MFQAGSKKISVKAMNRSRRVRRQMLAVRLHGPRDLRAERVPRPEKPGRGEVLLRVKATGICGSDLHSYCDGRIGTTVVEAPLILGHEFAGSVEAVGPAAKDGHFNMIHPGTRVAVDPAQPCGECESCEQGHPNLCGHLGFCGNYPYGGSLTEWMLMPARSCFPLPRQMSHETGALLEPLGVALHAVDFAKLRIGHTVAILGAGPIGLLILQLARSAGVEAAFVTDKLPWRLKLARKWGGIPIRSDRRDPVEAIQQATQGRGVDVVIEAAWGGVTVNQSAEMAKLGGRLVLVGIPGDDRLGLNHSVARRKGLTLIMSRRMKHCYPRAIRLAQEGRVDLANLVTHRIPLKQAPHAFALNAAYADNVVKVIIQS
jgi:L-iditol 2-dehydrogenase